MKKNILRILIIVLIIITIPFPAFAVNEDYIPIHIDGYYEDWDDKPEPIEVYPGHNPPEDKINYVSLFRNEDNVYVHVIFAFKNNQDITNMTIDLYTNMGNESYFIVPDHFWPLDLDSTEPDIILDQNTNTPGQDGGTENNSQNLYSGMDQNTYFAVADNNKNPETTADATTVTTDEKTDNGQGNSNSDTSGDTANNGQSSSSSDTSSNSQNNDSAGSTDEKAGNDQGNVSDNADQNSSTGSGVSNDPAEDTGLAIDSSLDTQGNMDLKKPGHYGTWSFSVWGGRAPVGCGYYTRTEGEPDELELNIPLSSIAHHYDGITEISMKIKKLGPQIIMCTGVSTEPYVGVAVGAGIAMLSVGAFTYRKKRPFSFNNGK
jgi:uncharacterized protein (TIGR04145 family)